MAEEVRLFLVPSIRRVGTPAAERHSDVLIRGRGRKRSPRGTKTQRQQKGFSLSKPTRCHGFHIEACRYLETNKREERSNSALQLSDCVTRLIFSADLEALKLPRDGCSEIND